MFNIGKDWKQAAAALGAALTFSGVINPSVLAAQPPQGPDTSPEISNTIRMDTPPILTLRASPEAEKEAVDLYAKSHITLEKMLPQKYPELYAAMREKHEELSQRANNIILPEPVLYVASEDPYGRMKQPVRADVYQNNPGGSNYLPSGNAYIIAFEARDLKHKSTDQLIQLLNEEMQTKNHEYNPVNDKYFTSRTFTADKAAQEESYDMMREKIKRITGRLDREAHPEIYAMVEEIHEKIVKNAQKLGMNVPPFPEILYSSSKETNASATSFQNYYPDAPNFYAFGNATFIVINKGFLENFTEEAIAKLPFFVTPAKAGVFNPLNDRDSCFRRNDNQVGKVNFAITSEEMQKGILYHEMMHLVNGFTPSIDNMMLGYVQNNKEFEEKIAKEAQKIIHAADPRISPDVLALSGTIPRQGMETRINENGKTEYEIMEATRSRQTGELYGDVGSIILQENQKPLQEVFNWYEKYSINKIVASHHDQLGIFQKQNGREATPSEEQNILQTAVANQFISRYFSGKHPSFATRSGVLENEAQRLLPDYTPNYTPDNTPATKKLIPQSQLSTSGRAGGI